ncbi:hypothetical protein CCUS01_15159 [Colletotrichum cuscutae]|uniref:Uncharacterized protein n=1 Tax=Colletotrichum cuscutae TaxID=1209917 RepID=A0AAI9Y881_9PEZI|nr:hypothetical protein CCUS01_15159 [Colletotrichum cuscutae]
MPKTSFLTSCPGSVQPSPDQNYCTGEFSLFVEFGRWEMTAFRMRLKGKSRRRKPARSRSVEMGLVHGLPQPTAKVLGRGGAAVPPLPAVAAAPPCPSWSINERNTTQPIHPHSFPIPAGPAPKPNMAAPSTFSRIQHCGTSPWVGTQTAIVRPSPCHRRGSPPSKLVNDTPREWQERERLMPNSIILHLRSDQSAPNDKPTMQNASSPTSTPETEIKFHNGIIKVLLENTFSIQPESTVVDEGNRVSAKIAGEPDFDTPYHIQKKNVCDMADWRPTEHATNGQHAVPPATKKQRIQPSSRDVWAAYQPDIHSGLAGTGHGRPSKAWGFLGGSLTKTPSNIGRMDKSTNDHPAVGEKLRYGVSPELPPNDSGLVVNTPSLTGYRQEAIALTTDLTFGAHLVQSNNTPHLFPLAAALWVDRLDSLVVGYVMALSGTKVQIPWRMNKDSYKETHKDQDNQRGSYANDRTKEATPRGWPWQGLEIDDDRGISAIAPAEPEEIYSEWLGPLAGKLGKFWKLTGRVQCHPKEIPRQEYARCRNMAMRSSAWNPSNQPFAEPAPARGIYDDESLLEFNATKRGLTKNRLAAYSSAAVFGHQSSRTLLSKAVWNGTYSKTWNISPWASGLSATYTDSDNKERAAGDKTADSGPKDVGLVNDMYRYVPRVVPAWSLNRHPVCRTRLLLGIPAIFLVVCSLYETWIQSSDFSSRKYCRKGGAGRPLIIVTHFDQVDRTKPPKWKRKRSFPGAIYGEEEVDDTSRGERLDAGGILERRLIKGRLKGGKLPGHCRRGTLGTESELACICGPPNSGLADEWEGTSHPSHPTAIDTRSQNQPYPCRRLILG